MDKFSLVRHLSNRLHLRPTDPAFRSVYSAYLEHLTRGATAFEFQRKVKQYMPRGLSVKAFRLELLENKYTFFTLKMFLFQMNTLKVHDRAASSSLGKRMGVHVKDVNIIQEMWEKDRHLRKRIRMWVAELPKGITLDPVEMEKEFLDHVYPKVFRYIKHISYKKLTFLVRSSNCDVKDFYNELAFKALQTFYKEVPSNKSNAHLVNYINRSVHNHVVNTIYEFTTKKKGRFICTGFDANSNRQFDLLETSESQIRASSVEAEVGAAQLVGGTIDPREQVDNEICIQTILDRFRGKSRKYRLLCILMGNVDVEFTTWLRARRHCGKGEDNTDLQERIELEEFRKLLSKFLHINDDQVNVFLLKLKNKVTTGTARRSYAPVNVTASR